MVFTGFVSAQEPAMTMTVIWGGAGPGRDAIVGTLLANTYLLGGMGSAMVAIRLLVGTDWTEDTKISRLRTISSTLGLSPKIIN